MHAPLCTPEATLASCFRAAQVHYSCHYGRTRGRIGLARRVAAAYVCIDIYIYIHTYTYIYIYIYICLFIYTPISKLYLRSLGTISELYKIEALNTIIVLTMQ